MRVDLPLVARLFEVLALGVGTGAPICRGNLDRCVRTVRGIVEREVGERAPADGRWFGGGRAHRPRSSSEQVGICCSRPDQSNQRKRCTQSVVKRLGSQNGILAISLPMPLRSRSRSREHVRTRPQSSRRRRRDRASVSRVSGDQLETAFRREGTPRSGTGWSATSGCRRRCRCPQRHSSWSTLTEYEKQLTMRVFTGLTLLDTIQGTVGAVVADPRRGDPARGRPAHQHRVHGVGVRQELSARSSHAVLHQGDRGRRLPLVGGERNLQRKAASSWSTTRGDDPLKTQGGLHAARRRFLFYSGLHLPMYWSRAAPSSPTPPTSSASIIRDECGARLLHRLQVSSAA